jgi:hypothetical protein
MPTTVYQPPLPPPGFSDLATGLQIVYQKGRSHINIANVSSDALKRSKLIFFIKETQCKSSRGNELVLLLRKAEE